MSGRKKRVVSPPEDGFELSNGMVPRSDRDGLIPMADSNREMMVENVLDVLIRERLAEKVGRARALAATGMNLRCTDCYRNGRDAALKIITEE